MEEQGAGREEVRAEGVKKLFCENVMIIPVVYVRIGFSVSK